MKQLRRQSVAQLNRVKRWQWGALSTVILGSAVVWGIYRTEFLAGVWGILNDEIAVVTIEGDEGDKQDITIADPSKSVWDGLELLGVPLVLAILGAWFQSSQQKQADRIAREQREQDGDETREEVLQLYFDRISTLLIDKNLMAIAAKKEFFDRVKREDISAMLLHDFIRKFGGFPGNSFRDFQRYLSEDNDIGAKEALGFNRAEQELLDVATDVIQARTLSILRRFEQDLERKTSVIRFLAEADVISRLRLDLSRTNLSNANLSNTNLSNANLSDANLSDANLSKANLSNTNLSNADLSSASIYSTDMKGADLEVASLCNTNLNTAKGLTEAQLSQALLCDTTAPEGLHIDANRDCELLKSERSLLEVQFLVSLDRI